MKNTGFRIDASKLVAKLEKAKDQIRADYFKPLVLDYARKVLNKCVSTTPVRLAQTIQSAQTKQYNNRINFIPSSHHKTDPALVVKGGKEFLFVGGKWYRPDKWKLPNDVYAVYQQLNNERQRRIQTPRTQFIKDRMQARFLYRKSWTQVGASIGLNVRGAANVSQSLTRRKPPDEPPKGYAQIRGGKKVFNIVVYNPFLNTEYGPLTKVYKPFTAQDIINPAIAQYHPAFLVQVDRYLQRALYAIMNK